MYTVIIYWDNENPTTYPFTDFAIAKECMTRAIEQGYHATITF